MSIKLANNYTILIADDEPNIRRVLEAVFTKDGYTVLIAENGKKALDIRPHYAGLQRC